MRITDADVHRNKDLLVKYILIAINGRGAYPYVFITSNETIQDVHNNYYSTYSLYDDGLLTFSNDKIILSSGIIMSLDLSDEELFHFMLSNPMDYEKYNIVLKIKSLFVRESLGWNEVVVSDLNYIISEKGVKK